MPRSPRLDYPGAWHHVFNRGVDHGAIFRTDGDRAYFLRCLSEASEKHAVEVHAYCLMSNHYHLLLRSQTGQLSRAMQMLSSFYTQGANLHLGRDGPIFRGRYQAVLITTDAQFLTVSRYIHLNPVQAGLIDSAADWPWSSLAAYYGGRRPLWLNRAYTLALFSGNGSEQSRYMEFIEDYEIGSDPIF